MRIPTSIMVFLLSAAVIPAHAQTPAPDGGQSKLTRKNGRGGSGLPVGERTLGVRTRIKTGTSGTSLDSAYQTITSEPSSLGLRDISAPNQPPALQPRTVTNQQQRPTPPVATVEEAGLPESMRIQRAADRANPQGPDLITPGGLSGPNALQQTARGEGNRIDASAPSRARLQVDDLSRQQPNSAGTTFGVFNASSAPLARPSMPSISRLGGSHSIMSSSHGSR